MKTHLPLALGSVYGLFFIWYIIHRVFFYLNKYQWRKRFLYFVPKGSREIAIQYIAERKWPWWQFIVVITSSVLVIFSRDLAVHSLMNCSIAFLLGIFLILCCSLLFYEFINGLVLVLNDQLYIRTLSTRYVLHVLKFDEVVEVKEVIVACGKARIQQLFIKTNAREYRILHVANVHELVTLFNNYEQSIT